MKVFVGQAVTGEDINLLRNESSEVCNILSDSGHKAYCTILEGDKFEAKNNKLKMKHAFKKLDSFDTFLAIVRSERRSEGMLMEIGYCIAKNKKIIIAIKNGVKNTYLPEIADQVITFETFTELNDKLKKLKLK